MAVPEAAQALQVSESTVWRLLRAGELESVVQHGRRRVLRRAVERRVRAREASSLRPLTPDHPLWKLVGSARSGGTRPGSEDKYGTLADE
ncbi:MAG: helix-turn-helix domain-containing protein [Myxococcales bacterium]|nr:helix-turn-helix domain-containing protein [Myxococcales bacterium]